MFSVIIKFELFKTVYTIAMLKISHTFITNKSESEKMNEDSELESL